MEVARLMSDCEHTEEHDRMRSSPVLICFNLEEAGQFRHDWRSHSIASGWNLADCQFFDLHIEIRNAVSNLASLKSAPARSLPDRFAPDRFTRPKLIFVKSTPTRVTAKAFLPRCQLHSTRHPLDETVTAFQESCNVCG